MDDTDNVAEASMDFNGFRFEYRGPEAFVDAQVSKTLDAAKPQLPKTGLKANGEHQPMLFDVEQDNTPLLAQSSVSLDSS